MLHFVPFFMRDGIAVCVALNKNRYAVKHDSFSENSDVQGAETSFLEFFAKKHLAVLR